MRLRDAVHLIGIYNDTKDQLGKTYRALLRDDLDPETRAKLMGLRRGEHFRLRELEEIDLTKDSGEPWIHHGGILIMIRAEEVGLDPAELARRMKCLR